VLLVRSFTEDTKQSLEFHPYLKIEHGQIKEQAEQIPDWANKLVQQIEQKQAQILAEKQRLQQEQKQQQTQSLIQKKGMGSGKDMDEGYDRGPKIGR
jgi:hypothetical protein